MSQSLTDYIATSQSSARLDGAVGGVLVLAMTRAPSTGLSANRGDAAIEGYLFGAPRRLMDRNH
jgi:hypothetical protein